MEQEVRERFERIEADLAITAHNLKETTTALGVLTQAIGKYTEASNARMSRMEENLDALIRAITAEHTNGKEP